MSKPYMLDTNAVSAFMHGRSRTLDRMLAVQRKSDLYVSSITYGETLYGLSNRPEALNLAAAAHALFQIVDILPWTTVTANIYGSLRAAMRRSGFSLQPLDMLIAAHALSVVATLVTQDRAFRHVPGLKVEDWSQD